MELTRVIIGPVVTEKSERLKAQRTYVLTVALAATKIDVKQALRRYYDVDVSSVRVMRTVPKVRLLGQGKVMEKRHRTKRVHVTLTPKSKALDLAAFRTS